LPAAFLDNIILVEEGVFYARSIAALRIARRLSWPWPLLYGAIIVPRPIRDFFNDWIARNRYRWFGKRDACRLPTPAERERFL
jgi:predicted DCC family thiol-disulfide oxidoreductase YuxK